MTVDRAAADALERDALHHCVTCSDEGCEMVVLRVDDARGLALCDRGDGTHVSVETALVGPTRPGDVLLVHAGTALTRTTEVPA